MSKKNDPILIGRRTPEGTYVSEAYDPGKPEHLAALDLFAGHCPECAAAAARERRRLRRQRESEPRLLVLPPKLPGLP